MKNMYSSSIKLNVGWILTIMKIVHTKLKCRNQFSKFTKIVVDNTFRINNDSQYGIKSNLGIGILKQV